MNEEQIKAYQQRVCDILMDDYFPPSEEITITPERVRKNNNFIKHGIVIRTNDSSVAPTFYVDDFLETHEPEAAAEAIYRAYQANRQEAAELNENRISMLFDFEQCKDKICYRLMNSARNADIMDKCPTIQIAPDLIMAFYLQVQDNATCLIKNELAQMWGITEDVEKTLFSYADQNTPRLHPARLQTMAAIMREMIPEKLRDEMEIDTLSPPMYILSNDQRVSGACTVLYRNGQQLKDSLKVVQEQYEVDEFYIIPSSIHEVILVPALPDITKEELQSMCQTVNETQVPYDEFLSDNIFAYNAIEGFRQITFAERDLSR